jgi:hypothetical protein
MKFALASLLLAMSATAANAATLYPGTGVTDGTAFCASKGKVLVDQKEWCLYAKSNKVTGVYGNTPIFGGSCIDVEDVCGIPKPTPAPTSAPTAKPTDAPTAKPTAVPTPVPTVKPTSAPTAKPTVAPVDYTKATIAPRPTSKPTSKPTLRTVTTTSSGIGGATRAPRRRKLLAVEKCENVEYILCTEPPKKGSSSGDPHFKTWYGDKFDYHGECDLVLVDNPSFNNGQGLRVHIRTTRVKYFSYIERVAVQIGQDTLEFDNDIENFFINGEKVESNHKHHKTHLGGFIVRRDPKAISIRLHDEGRRTHQNAKIDLHARKNGFPAVIVDGGNTDMFKGSLGLLGDWSTGQRVGRDGTTVIEDHTEYALEWQVRDVDPTLFLQSRFPQFPQTCTPPEKMVPRLGMDAAIKEAEKACDHWEEDKEDCIFDVIATRDVSVALEGHISTN